MSVSPKKELRCSNLRTKAAPSSNCFLTDLRSEQLKMRQLKVTAQKSLQASNKKVALSSDKQVRSRKRFKKTEKLAKTKEKLLKFQR